MSPNAKEQAHSLPGAPSEFVAANFKAVIEALDLGPEASRSDYQITARNKVKEAHPEVFRIESEATTQAAVKEDAEAEDKSLTTSYVVVPSTTEIDIDAIVKVSCSAPRTARLCAIQRVTSGCTSTGSSTGNCRQIESSRTDRCQVFECQGWHQSSRQNTGLLRRHFSIGCVLSN